MFSSQLFDVVIGMVFMYLALSLLCSGINEWIAQLFDSRAQHLEAWLEDVLKGKEGEKEQDEHGTALIDTFKQHPLIKTLVPRSKQSKDTPSYIQSQTFVLALLLVNSM